MKRKRHVRFRPSLWSLELKLRAMAMHYLINGKGRLKEGFVSAKNPVEHLALENDLRELQWQLIPLGLSRLVGLKRV